MSAPDTRGYRPGHPWYYLLGGEVLSPKVIRFEARLAGYKGYRQEEILIAAGKPEPQRSQLLSKIRGEVQHSLSANISRYREVARELHAYRRSHAGEPVPNCSEAVHTSMSLKYAHIYNDFAHLDLLDSLPQQTSLFDLL
ncbi:hypothetical protein BCF33_0378 [Hasllibacter halocynthiae]|uniref:Uncharacterized protein n=1 Tax=Hasllibacter halocynthiae TaxID=595589 RepID=A0A2T0X755_9RHOB|nr:hypothetical protein [Hasllibacter halocynthiae]PRY94780.1 hypothetical protein BCF33_0378 [Hasllibacter halocynthiae]